MSIYFEIETCKHVDRSIYKPKCSSVEFDDEVDEGFASILEITVNWPFNEASILTYVYFNEAFRGKSDPEFQTTLW